MKNSKKFLIIFFALFLFSTILVSARETEITYPEIPGVDVVRPTKTTDLLPDYIRYIFTFSIIIAAIIAFGSFFYGGFRWLMSTGSPSAISSAKDRMKAGGLGLIAILFSYVILNTINPQLLAVNPSTAVSWGITLYANGDCTGNEKKVTRNTAELTGFNSFLFNADIPLHSLDIKINGSTVIPRDNNLGCRGVAGGISSVEFIWKLPGVYLVNRENKERFLPASTATLGDFNNNVGRVKFNNIENVSYGAVMHEDQNWKSNCKIFTDSGDVSGIGVSSVTTFTRAASAGPGGVTFYKDDNFNGEESPNYQNQYVPVFGSGWNDQTTSIKISGNYIAVLFENDNYGGKCQVFIGSDSNLRDDEIGRCGCGPFGWGCTDCLSSFIVLPTR